MTRADKQFGSFLIPHEGFNCGSEKYQVFLKIHSNDQFSQIQLLDDQRILVKPSMVQEKRLSKKEQRDKVYTFSRIFHQRISNEDLYRNIFPNFIQQFLSGTNQTVFILGPRRSGKSSMTIGSLRDPGIILYYMQDLFNFIEDRFFEDHITVKLSIFESHPTKGFRDLLITRDFEFQPYTLQVGDNQLLGIPEIIVDNFLIAMKVIRIALANLQNMEQNLDTEGYQDRLRDTSLMIEVKAEIAPTEDIREQVIISRTRFIKTLSEEPIDERRSGGSLMTNLGTVLRNMSEATTKSRKAVPFRSHPLIDYLRDAISSHSSVRVICCINSIDYSETLRISGYASTILNHQTQVQFSIFKWNAQLKDLIENEKDSVGLFAKDFQNHDVNKAKRGRVIFQILQSLQGQINDILDVLEQRGELMYTLNCLYSQILSHHCGKYQNIITTEDVKEFFLAKIELYSVEQIKYYQDQVAGYLNTALHDLYSRFQEFNQLRVKLIKYSNVNLSKIIQQITQQRYPEITNFDVQRLSNTTKLLLKLLSLFVSTASQNIFNHQEARESLSYIFQDVNLISGKYLDVVDEYDLKTKEDQPIEVRTSYIQKISTHSQESISIEKINASNPAVEKNRTRTTAFDNDTEEDLISKLFTDKNTRNYQAPMSQHAFFRTQPPQRKHSTLLMQRLRHSPETQNKYNFFQELQKRQTGIAISQEINPNQIHQMVAEWQEKRHLRQTGISFMKQSYTSFPDREELPPQQKALVKRTEPSSHQEMEQTLPQPYKTAQQFKYSIVSSSSTQFKLPKLNLKEQQFKKYYLQ